MLPIIKKIPYRNPEEVLIYFFDQEWLCFLDSAKRINNIGNFSFITFNPFLKIVAKENKITINGVNTQGDPFIILKQELSKYKLPTKKKFPPFQGGALGYFSYDLLRYIENIPKHRLNLMDLPEMTIGFYDTVIAFDHKSKTSWVLSNGFPEKNIHKRKEKAEESCAFIIRKLSEEISYPTSKKWSIKDNTIKSNFDKASYHKMVSKVINYIYAGDIFQANVSQCFSSILPEGITSLDLYLKLRSKNPAPFGAFLNYGDISIASSSPERFIKLIANKVETRPIKGTRTRSKDPIEDDLLASELIKSEKDRSENIMIVDLMRNDLSRVCIDDSIIVKKLCGLETFETVHHLVSIVEGKIKPEYDAIDLLRATFPGGSITGAPKIRAMEIIAELENTSRGPYCGSIGYIGFDSTMDTSITIRTFVAKGNEITFQAGGGIVADSIPDEEYRETLTKAASLFNVLTNE